MPELYVWGTHFTLSLFMDPNTPRVGLFNCKFFPSKKKKKTLQFFSFLVTKLIRIVFLLLTIAYCGILQSLPDCALQVKTWGLQGYAPG